MLGVWVGVELVGAVVVGVELVAGVVTLVVVGVVDAAFGSAGAVPVSVGLGSIAGGIPGFVAVTEPGVALVGVVAVEDGPVDDVLVDDGACDAGGQVIPLPSLHGLGTMYENDGVSFADFRSLNSCGSATSDEGQLGTSDWK